MKTEEKQKLHQSASSDLIKKILELEHDYAKIKLSIKAGKEKNLRAGRNIKQKIAIIKTILSQQR